MSQPPAPGEPQKSEWSKFIAGFDYAFHGLWYALRTQRNARVHIIIAILAITMGIGLNISTVDFAMIFGAIAGVFMADLFNTVFTLGINLASPQYPPLAQEEKELPVGAALLDT